MLIKHETQVEFLVNFTNKPSKQGNKKLIYIYISYCYTSLPPSLFYDFSNKYFGKVC